MNKRRHPVEERKLEVADIFRQYGDEFRGSMPANSDQLRVMHHIEICRTAALGGHVEQCDNCNFQQNAYNSCRDRHCPKCQTLVKEKWLNDRKAELLPCGYYHNVFTLPHKLNSIILNNKEVCFTILFAAVKETLQAFAADPQWRLVGTLGFIGVLHTWSQKLLGHFHLHCVIPAGVLSFDKEQWKPAKGNYLFRTESLAKEFKKRYLKKLLAAYANNKLVFPGKTEDLSPSKGFEKLIEQARNKDWIVYSKKPFAGPEQVLEYLGRYTHRVAISNNRIKEIGNGEVTFTYRDRQDENKEKELTLSAMEFIRRFLMHVLPKGFMKIRYFGFLSHRNKKKIIPVLRRLIDPQAELPEKITETVQEMMLRLTGADIGCCPKCQKGRMIIIKELPGPRWDTS
jgi:hypothetical protein